MDEKKAKVLVLVEGAKTDVHIMNHLFEVYGIDKNHQIVSYNTNIYELYRRMFVNVDPYEMDLLQVLKERDPDNRALDDRYSDILLIFDLDQQDGRFSEASIREMVGYFTDSTDMGKLYLNYPMVEAYYHMKTIPDNDYPAYTATLDELKAKQYKARVRRECRNGYPRKYAVNKEECDSIIRQNIDKARQIIGDDRKTDGAVPDGMEILSAQLEQLKTCRSVYVLCTCVYYIPDYNPNLVLGLA